MKKKLFEELLESVKQAKAIEKGELKASRVVKVTAKTDIVRVRGKQTVKRKASIHLKNVKG